MSHSKRVKHTTVQS